MTVTAEEAAINRYLLFLEDPASIIDAKAIKAAEKKVADAPSPAQKVLAITELEKIQQGDPTDVIAEFVKAAKSWGASASAWKAMNVPADIVAQITGAGRSAAKAKPKGDRADRNVTVEQIQDAALSLPDGFTYADVKGVINASPIKISDAVNALVESHKLVATNTRPKTFSKA